MNFDESTHKLSWLFPPTQLEKLRQENLQRALCKSITADGSPAADHARDVARGAGPITTEEEQLLLQFYGSKISVIAQQLGLPRKVVLTALMFLKRFYLGKSVLEADPARFMLTAIYLACKAEESYISADDFCKAVRQEPSIVLQNEVTLLQGLRFDLVVHHPLWSLQGFFVDFDTWRADPSSNADASIRAAPVSQLQQAHSAAKAALNAVMLTDAPLIHPPGILALAAMDSGFQQEAVSLDGFLRRVAAKHEAEYTDLIGNSTQDVALVALHESLSAVNTMIRLGLRNISEAQVKEIDRKLKAQKKSRSRSRP